MYHALCLTRALCLKRQTTYGRDGRKGVAVEYHETVRLKDGRECMLRNGTEQDARAVLDNFIQTHAETDWLLSYPDEITLTLEQEAQYLKSMTESPDRIEIIAEVDGAVVGTAGIDRIGTSYKIGHRASFGISIVRAYWGLGIGRALTRACVACAKKAGYSQVELDVVAENEAAVALYESEAFVVYGRNPKGFNSRTAGMQELVLMRLELG